MPSYYIKLYVVHKNMSAGNFLKAISRLFEGGMKIHEIMAVSGHSTAGQLFRNVQVVEASRTAQEIKENGGEEGIRTPGKGFPLQRFSKPPPSATRPPLRKMRVKSGIHPTAFAQFNYEHCPLVSILKCRFFR